MTDRKTGVVKQVRADVLDHMRDFQNYGPAYIEGYATAVLSGRLSRPDHSRIHPKLAEFVREVVLDVASADRRPAQDTEQQKAA